MIPLLKGALAGILEQMGELKRAKEILQQLLAGKAYGTPLGIFRYHLICNEIDEAAGWLEKAIGQRHILAVDKLKLISSSSRWPAIAEKLNLPDEAF